MVEKAKYFGHQLWDFPFTTGVGIKAGEMTRVFWNQIEKHSWIALVLSGFRGRAVRGRAVLRPSLHFTN